MSEELNNELPQDSWQESLMQGRLTEAHKYYILQDNPDPEILRALDTLTEIEILIRGRSLNQSLRKLNRLESPPDLLDWDELKNQLNSLKTSGAALDRRRPEDALKELEGVTFSFLEAEVQTQRGTALIFMKDSDGATEAFREALNLDPKHYRALTNLGNIALEQNRIDEAIESYEGALRLNGDFGNAHHNLGVAYRRKGQVRKSVRSLKKAQRVDGRVDREEARASLNKSSRTKGLKLLRWLAYAIILVVVFIFLRSRGYF
jgi:tetratricopeptide (TPR) repeat protein